MPRRSLRIIINRQQNYHLFLQSTDRQQFILFKTVAMPPKIGGGVSPNGYAPEFSGAEFRQTAMSPNFRGPFFTPNGYAPIMSAAEF